MAVRSDSKNPVLKAYSKMRLTIDEPSNYNEMMSSAASAGHTDIVRLMLEKGATDYNRAMMYAAEGGHMDIVKLMLEKGANNYDEAISFAVLWGHIDIAKLIIEKGATANKAHRKTDVRKRRK